MELPKKYKYVKYVISEVFKNVKDILEYFIKAEDIVYIHPNLSPLTGAIVFPDESTANTCLAKSGSVERGWTLTVDEIKTIRP